MDKICFKSEERAAKERLSQQIIFLKKLVSKSYLYIGIFENSFLFYGQPSLTTLGNPFKVLRNCLKEQTLLLLHVAYLKKFF